MSLGCRFALVAFYTRDFKLAAIHYNNLIAFNSKGGSDFYGAISFASGLGYSLLQTGQREKGTRALEQAEQNDLAALKIAPDHPERLYDLAATQAGLGRDKESVSTLEKAIAAGWTGLRWMQCDPRVSHLAGDQRFMKLRADLDQKVRKMRELANRVQLLENSTTTTKEINE